MHHPTWHVNVITLFPQCFPGPLDHSITSRAHKAGRWTLRTEDLRKHGIGPHKIVDDAPYGGGPGMLIRPDVVDSALRATTGSTPNDKQPIIYMSPSGTQFNGSIAQSLIKHPSITLLCGRYEGIDQRVLDRWNVQYIRVGDAVLCGGEIPAMIVIEACVRLLPGVIEQASLECETSVESGVGEHPQYTRPAEWEGLDVPSVLTSGNHSLIKQWQKDNCTKL
jgi:tRNA (guanine37-N1)-methyltransferase